MKLSHVVEYSQELRDAHAERCTMSFEKLEELFELVSKAAPDMRASVETHKKHFSWLLDAPDNMELKMLFNEHIRNCDTCRNTLIIMAAEHQTEVDFIRFCRKSAN